MMYKIKHLIFIASLVIISCKDGKQRHEYPAKLFPTKQSAEKPYVNPALIYSSSFGNFFQALYRTNQFETMLAFTSDKTKAKFGDQLLPYYQSDFKFDYSLGKLTNVSYRGDTILLTYAKTYIYGTRRKVVIGCHVENDSVKIVLHSLDKTQFE